MIARSVWGSSSALSLAIVTAVATDTASKIAIGAVINQLPEKLRKYYIRMAIRNLTDAAQLAEVMRHNQRNQIAMVSAVADPRPESVARSGGRFRVVIADEPVPACVWHSSPPW